VGPNTGDFWASQWVLEDHRPADSIHRKSDLFADLDSNNCLAASKYQRCTDAKSHMLK